MKTGVPMNEPWFVTPLDFLGKMAPGDKDRLLGIAQRQAYRKNALIFQAGSPGKHVYFLLEGRVKIYALSTSGKATLLWFCFPGEVFGFAEITRGGPREVYAQACTDTVVMTIARDEFKAFLVDHPSTAMMVIDVLSCRLRTLGDMLINLTADDVSTRLVKLLTRLAARYGKHVDSRDTILAIPLTHQDIADMIGTSRQTVTSVLNELKRKDVLYIENHMIHICRQDLLERLVSDVALAPAPRLQGAATTASVR